MPSLCKCWGWGWVFMRLSQAGAHERLDCATALTLFCCACSYAATHAHGLHAMHLLNSWLRCQALCSTCAAACAHRLTCHITHNSRLTRPFCACDPHEQTHLRCKSVLSTHERACTHTHARTYIRTQECTHTRTFSMHMPSLATWVCSTPLMRMQHEEGG